MRTLAIFFLSLTLGACLGSFLNATDASSIVTSPAEQVAASAKPFGTQILNSLKAGAVSIVKSGVTAAGLAPKTAPAAPPKNFADLNWSEIITTGWKWTSSGLGHTYNFWNKTLQPLCIKGFNECSATVVEAGKLGYCGFQQSANLVWKHPEACGSLLGLLALYYGLSYFDSSLKIAYDQLQQFIDRPIESIEELDVDQIKIIEKNIKWALGHTSLTRFTSPASYFLTYPYENKVIESLFGQVRTLKASLPVAASLHASEERKIAAAARRVQQLILSRKWTTSGALAMIER